MLSAVSGGVHLSFFVKYLFRSFVLLSFLLEELFSLALVRYRLERLSEKEERPWNIGESLMWYLPNPIARVKSALHIQE